MVFEIDSINGKRIIGTGHPTYIIAELSCNHNQDIDIALELIKSAKDSGADAIKIQSYTADSLTLDCDNDYFRINGTIWDNQKLYELYSKAMTPYEWIPKLKETANGLGMDFFSSPFDEAAVDYLEQIGVPMYKVASFEIVDMILLKRIAQTGKPVIVSTGLATEDEISEAINMLKSNNSGPIALLKCTSAYPAKPESANLITMIDMKNKYNTIVGLSDHTLDIEVPIVSVSLGGNIIEKHYTLSRKSGSFDDEFSLEPHEFKNMVKSIRITEKVIGNVTYGGTIDEKNSKQLRRSLFITKDVNKDEVLSNTNLKSIRPGYGLHTRHYWNLLGQVVNTDLKKGTPMSLEYVNIHE